MPLADVQYMSSAEAAEALSLSERTIRILCEQFDWFGGKVGNLWVITQEEVDKMKVTPRRGPGQPRKPIGDSME
jgi:hypothetical protein